ncbi:MAG: hypothetical protein JRC53_06360, partial [Deltaproteobacteria bacterium]|nr:hypothetical protein [Deltaproteobacteria bacterium]
MWQRPVHCSLRGNRRIIMAREIYYEDVNVGDAMPELVKGPLQKLQHVMYAGASGDFNPLHTDDDFAKAVGMKDGVIAHGMLIM